MMIMARDRSYAELRSAIEGKRAAIWTCGTCARSCWEFGGIESADRLAAALRKDGIDVTDVRSVSAGCIVPKLIGNAGFGNGSDVIVSLTCSIGAECAERVFGKPVINPAVTYGSGFLDSEGPVTVSGGTHIPLSEKTSPDDAPFV